MFYIIIWVTLKRKDDLLWNVSLN